jgi:hypothetical protein
MPVPYQEKWLALGNDQALLAVGRWWGKNVDMSLIGKVNESRQNESFYFCVAGKEYAREQKILVENIRIWLGVIQKNNPWLCKVNWSKQNSDGIFVYFREKIWI